MTDKRIIRIFWILQIILLLSSFILVDLPIIFKIITMFLELYYLVFLNKKNITIFLYVLIFSFLGYGAFLVDKTDMISLVYISLTTMFLWNYYKNKEFIKINVVNLFKFTSIVISIFSLFFVVNDSYSYILVLSLPLFIKNYEKDTNVFDLVCSFLVLFSLFTFRNRLLDVLSIGYLVVVLIWGFINLKENGSKIGIIIPEIVLIFTVFLIDFYPPYLHYIDSKYFENEFFIVKVLKSFIPLIPFLYIAFCYGKKIINNYKNIDINFFSYIYIILEIILIVFFTRLDINDFTVIMSIILGITMFKYLDSIDDKLNENDVTIMALHLGYGGIEKYLSSLCKMIGSYNINIISTYKVCDEPPFDFNCNISYLMEYGPNEKEFINEKNNHNLLGIIREGFKALIILYNKRFMNIESIWDSNSKYIITTRDFHNYLAGCYSKGGVIKIATEHNYHNNDSKYVSRIVRSVRDVNYFVLVSQELKKYYEKRVKPKCIYIPNVIDKEPSKKSKCNTKNIISVGRLSKEKGQKDLIEIVSIIKKDIPNIKLYLVGDGDLKEELISYSKSLRVSKNVSFTGFLNEKEIEKLMLDSSVYVSTSYTESFGLSVLEASSYGVPVVSFDSASGIKFILEDGCGVLIKNRDKDLFASSVVELLTDKKLMKEKKEKSINRSREFLLDNIKDKWLQLLGRR